MISEIAQFLLSQNENVCEQIAKLEVDKQGLVKDLAKADQKN